MSAEDSLSWSPKEVFADLKTDLMGRLDKQDNTLSEISRALNNTATKDDIRALHGRVDGVVDRVKTIEDARTVERAVADHQAGAKSSRRKWVAGLITAVVVPFGCSLLYILH